MSGESRTCRTCKNWKANVFSNAGKCCAINIGFAKFPEDGATDKATLFLDDEYAIPVPENGACARDASEYCAALYTGPSFGCTNWEADA